MLSNHILSEEVSNKRNAKLQRTSYFVKSNLQWFQNNADFLQNIGVSRKTPLHLSLSLNAE